MGVVVYRPVDAHEQLQSSVKYAATCVGVGGVFAVSLTTPLTTHHNCAAALHVAAAITSHHHQFGPPIVMGSIAGSYINYFVPGWVTKLLVLLVLSPMTYRMICKARMLW